MISIEGVPQTSMDLIRLILINQMRMAQDRVNIYDNKWIMPNTDDMFVTIEYRNGKTIGNNREFINQASFNEPIEIQTVNMFEKIVVGVFSRSNEAQYRKEEVLMAIESSYAELFQESCGFKIGHNPTIEDLSALEASAMLLRYDIELNIWAWYQRTIKPGYLIPPFNIMVTANDQGTGILTAEVTASSQEPSN